MEISSTQYKHCDLIKANGRIDSSSSAHLAEAFNKVIEAGRFKIVFDMSEVSFLSSAGMRVLINTQKTCKRYNRGQVVLAGVPALIREALDLAGFIPLFNIFEDVVNAVGNI